MFAGLFKTLTTIVAVWFIWRQLDRVFGGRRGRFSDATEPTSTSSGARKRANDSKEGEYVDFEELKD
jgi:hypothetical protein